MFQVYVGVTSKAGSLALHLHVYDGREGGLRRRGHPLDVHHHEVVPVVVDLVLRRVRPGTGGG